MKQSQRISNLKIPAQISLFGVSYLPLFLILIARIIYNHRDYLNIGELNLDGLKICLENFWIVFALILFIIGSVLGTIQTFKGINKHKENGFNVSISNINSKSAETINYISTYIIPFVFDVNSLFNGFIMLLLVAFIFLIYINSSLLIINPILAMKFGVFEIEFKEGEISRNVIVISPNKYLLEGDNVKLYEIGHKLYYCF